MGILCLNFETESVPSIIQLELNRGSTRANTGTRGSRASSDISEEKSHKKGLIRFKICMMIYTQHSTAPHNLILVYLSVNLISQIQMFDVSTFLFSFQCLKSWRPSDPLSFSLKILHFFFFFNHFSLWSLSSLEKSSFLTSRTHSHKPQGHLLNCMARNYPISIIL